MSKLSWKTIGLAAVVAGGAQLAMIGGATALVLPVPGQATVGETGQLDGQLLQVHYKKKYNKSHGYNKSYNRQRHGRRYTHKRRGYGHHYGGYWYASPWWVVAAPTVAIAVPTVTFGGNAHVQSCMNRYRSYNAGTDMFFGYDGRYHRCIGTY